MKILKEYARYGVDTKMLPTYRLTDIPIIPKCVRHLVINLKNAKGFNICFNNFKATTSKFVELISPAEQVLLIDGR